MSLKVWLSGDYKNRGSADISVTNNGTTLDSDRNSYVFNGSNSYISTVCTDYPTIFSGDFSIAFWTYSNDDGSRSVYIGNYGLSGSGNWFNLEKYSNDVIRIWWHDGSPDIRATTTIKAADGWVHICVTRAGNTFKIFKNGVLDQTISNYTISNDIPSTATTFYIGTDYRTSSDIVLKGKLADFRIYDEAISPELIRHLSRQPHEKELKVWLPLNGDLRNQGTADVTVTNNGATVDNSGKMGKCYSFGTSGGRLELSTDAIKTCTGDVSFALWVKILTWNTNYATIFDVQDGSISWNNEIFAFQRNGSSSGCCFTVSNGNTGSGNYTANSCRTGDLNLNQWYHFVCIYKTGKIQIWQDGVLVSEYSTSVVPNISKIQNFIIGSANTSNSYQSNILLNDFRLYSYALSPEEIKKISQGLALHYRLSGIGGENEFLGTADDDWWTKCTCHNIGGASYEIIQDDYLSGFQILKITRQNNTNQSGVYTYPTRNRMINGEMAQDETYTLSFMMKASTSGVETIPNIIAEAQTMVSCSHGLSWTEIPTKWTKYWITFTVKNPKQAICFYMRGTASAIVYFGKIKLEKGSKATPWLPNTTDSLYSTMRLDNDIEYDISGFNNNGTKSPVVIINTDSPRYETSYGTSSNSYFVNGGKISNILCQETPEYTVNLWCYKDNWTDNASELFSCAEGGGFAFDTTTSGFRTWSNVYTNADKTSYSYIAYTQTHAISSGWHMFTLVDDLTGTKAYIDGELIRTAASTNYGLHLNVNANLYIGAESTGGSYTSPYLNGRVSDFRIYATALSASDVQALYNLGEV